MALRYLAIGAIASAATYGAVHISDRGAGEPVIEERACASTPQNFTDRSGRELEVTYGPSGPRIGDLGYLAENLSHEEKVRLLTSDGFDGIGVVERMASDLYVNRERVASDIYRSIERILGGEW